MSDRQRLNPAFKHAIRESGYRLVTLAALTDFAASSQLSRLLARRFVPTTPLTISRLGKLAELINFDGPIFREGGGR